LVFGLRLRSDVERRRSSLFRGRRRAAKTHEINWWNDEHWRLDEYWRLDCDRRYHRHRRDDEYWRQRE
jgi:hypothetical protein